MKNKIIITLLASTLLLIVGLSACKKLLITPDEVGNEPVRNFELFWNDVDKTYPFFEDDKIDWQAIYDKYRPMVNNNTSIEYLLNILSDMMEPLRDGHRSITYNNKTYFSSPPKYKRIAKYNFNLIEGQYLSNFNVKTQPDFFEPTEMDTTLITGTIFGGKYAYVGVRSFYTDDDLAGLVTSHVLANSQFKGIVLDLRNNGGGYLGVMWDLMGLFTDNDVPYATYQPKVGPLKDNLMPLELLNKPDFAIPADGTLSNKKVVIITNRRCYSSTEHATLAAKQMGIPIVGDTTGGALSVVVEKTLPNGIQYVLVNSRTLDINGKLWERLGVPPTFPITTSSQDFKTKDPYMEAAILKLEQMQ